MNTIAQIIYDNYKGEIPAEFSAKTKKEREDMIRGKIFEVMGISEYTDSKTFRRALRENEAKVFNIIEEVIDTAIQNGEIEKRAFYNQFVEVKNLALGDKNEFYVPGKNQIVVSEFSGNSFELKRRRIDKGQSFSLEMRDFGVRVYEELDRCMSGRSSLVDLVVILMDAVDKHLADLAEATFMKAVDNLPAQFKFTGSYDEEDILEVLAHVEAANGIKPRIIGTKAAIAKLQGAMPVDMYSSDMKNEVNARGYMTVWKGYECVEIAQRHALEGDFVFTMPTDKLFFMSGSEKLVKMVLEGESRVKEISGYANGNADLTQEYMLTYRAAAAVANSGLIGVATLS